MPQAPVQQKIEIEDIQDDMVFLKGKGLRAILLTTAVNFALKSNDEQDALIYQYQNFLNSLDFPIQIVVISRRLDIAPYLAMLEEKRKEQSNELLRIQIEEYLDFVKNLVQLSNIVSQMFLVVVPLAPIEKKGGGLLEKIGLFEKNANQTAQKSLEELKSQLWQRVEYVKTGLGSVGVKAAPLNTQEIIELFYKLYNPSSKEKPQILKS